MADKETEIEWAKSKRIEAEKEKARQAMNGAKPDALSLAYLGPDRGKVKGWSSDSRLIMAKAEKLSAWSVILALAGIVLMIIADLGGIVSTANKLGLAGLILDIPGWVGEICLILAVFFGVIGVTVAIYYKLKSKQEMGAAGWSGVIGVLMVVIYWLIRDWLMGV